MTPMIADSSLNSPGNFGNISPVSLSKKPPPLSPLAEAAVSLADLGVRARRKIGEAPDPLDTDMEQMLYPLISGDTFRLEDILKFIKFYYKFMFRTGKASGEISEPNYEEIRDLINQTGEYFEVVLNKVDPSNFNIMDVSSKPRTFRFYSSGIVEYYDDETKKGFFKIGVYDHDHPFETKIKYDDKNFKFEITCLINSRSSFGLAQRIASHFDSSGQDKYNEETYVLKVIGGDDEEVTYNRVCREINRIKILSKIRVLLRARLLPLLMERHGNSELQELYMYYYNIYKHIISGFKQEIITGTPFHFSGTRLTKLVIQQHTGFVTEYLKNPSGFTQEIFKEAITRDYLIGPKFFMVPLYFILKQIDLSMLKQIATCLDIFIIDGNKEKMVKHIHDYLFNDEEFLYKCFIICQKIHQMIFQNQLSMIEAETSSAVGVDVVKEVEEMVKQTYRTYQGAGPAGAVVQKDVSKIISLCRNEFHLKMLLDIFKGEQSKRFYEDLKAIHCGDRSVVKVPPLEYCGTDHTFILEHRDKYYRVNRGNIPSLICDRFFILKDVNGGPTRMAETSRSGEGVPLAKVSSRVAPSPAAYSPL